MPNLVPDPGFENENWNLLGDSGRASYVSSPVYAGTRSLNLQILANFDGSHEAGWATSQVFSIPDPGVARDFEIKVMRDDPETYFELLVRHFPNGTGMPAVNIADIESEDLSAGWNVLSYSITPNGADDQIEILPQYRRPAGPPYPVDSINWHFDSLIYGEDAVAIKLAERGVQAVIALLRAELGTELAAIDADRADGVTMAVPAAGAYHNHVTREDYSDPHVMVFEGPFEFENSSIDIQEARAKFTLPITIRVVWRNRDGDTEDTMVTRGQRYSAGVYNAIMKNWTLDDSEDETKIGEILSVTPASSISTPDESGFLRGQIELAATIDCSETQ